MEVTLLETDIQQPDQLVNVNAECVHDGSHLLDWEMLKCVFDLPISPSDYCLIGSSVLAAHRLIPSKDVTDIDIIVSGRAVYILKSMFGDTYSGKYNSYRWQFGSNIEIYSNWLGHLYNKGIFFDTNGIIQGAKLFQVGEKRIHVASVTDYFRTINILNRPKDLTPIYNGKSRLQIAKEYLSNQSTVIM